MNTKIYNQADKLLLELGISEATFFAFTGLSPQSLKADDKDFERNRFDAICTIFAMLKTWFDSPREAWEWYTKQPIIGFGSLTPAEVIMEEQDAGATAVLNYIRSKELGGFE